MCICGWTNSVTGKGWRDGGMEVAVAPWLLKDFEGVPTFMFFYSTKDKLNTTLLCSLYARNKRITFNALLFMIFCLCYFSCCNIVAKFTLLEFYLSIMPMFRVL